MRKVYIGKRLINRAVKARAAAQNNRKSFPSTTHCPIAQYFRMESGLSLEGIGANGMVHTNGGSSFSVLESDQDKALRFTMSFDCGFTPEPITLTYPTLEPRKKIVENELD